MKESDMSAPLKKHLESQGYQVNCEVRNCDMTALKGDELIIIELKKQMSLRFLYQTLQRKTLSDSIYLALPVIGPKSYPPEFKNLKSLLKRLEMGLILVRFLKTKTKIELIQHPDQWETIKRPKRKQSILREINARGTEYNQAGSESKTAKITAYRKQVIQIARLMEDDKIWAPIELKGKGCSENSGSILRLNHYGWFTREARGKYRLNPVGHEALKSYNNIKID